MEQLHNSASIIAISVMLVGIAILMLCLVLMARLPRPEKKPATVERDTDWRGMCQSLQTTMSSQQEANEQYLESVHTALGTANRRIDELTAKNQTLFDENAQLHADKIQLGTQTTSADGIKWQDHAVIERHARVSIVRGIEAAIAKTDDGDEHDAVYRLTRLIQEVQQSVKEAEQIRTKSKEPETTAV